MREAMIKCIILTGIPSVIEALSAVAKLEREEDKDHSFSRFVEIPLSDLSHSSQIVREIG